MPKRAPIRKPGLGECEGVGCPLCLRDERELRLAHRQKIGLAPGARQIDTAGKPGARFIVVAQHPGRVAKPRQRPGAKQQIAALFEQLVPLAQQLTRLSRPAILCGAPAVQAQDLAQCPVKRRVVWRRARDAEDARGFAKHQEDFLE